MDLRTYNKEELFFTAIRAEIDSKAVYQRLADGVNNAFLKDKLKFLAGEEDKHRSYLETAYNAQFPGRELELPESTPVPLPELKPPDEKVPVSEVIESAMNAELAAKEFYLEFAKTFEDDSNSELRKTLEYFSTMEDGHYNLLKQEKQNIETFEEYDDYWPMMHAGT
jgi:rubrerythrin